MHHPMAPPKSLVPRHYGQRGPHCGVSLDIHHSLGPPWGHAGLVKGGCVRVACPEDAGPFVTPELFLLVCKPSRPSWELLRPVENPMASAEAGWCWRGAGRAPACEFARDPLCWIRNGCQKELDSRLAWHLGCLPDPLVEGTMAIMVTKKFLLRRRRACVA